MNSYQKTLVNGRIGKRAARFHLGLKGSSEGRWQAAYRRATHRGPI